MEIIVVAAMLSLVVLLGIAVKLYDLKRKREEEAVAAQARNGIVNAGMNALTSAVRWMNRSKCAQST